MSFNWIDWIIIASVVYYSYRGWEAGFFPLATSLISFVAALWLAVRFQLPVSSFLTEKFGVAGAWSTVLAYIVIAFGAQLLMEEVLHMLIEKIPKKILHSKVSNWVGALVSAANGLVIVTFFLLIILALPLRGTVKKDIQASSVGSRITNIVEKYGGPIKSAVEEVRQEAVKFFTVAPQSKETISLDVSPKASDLTTDEAVEKKMLTMVNAERAKVGAPALKMEAKITAVARAHSRDMFMRRYFSHYTPEGTDAGDRLSDGGVNYTVAGENLAYSPDVETAHTGLMNSPEHKKNILDPQFERIGIGIISTSSYGIMVTQNFTN